MGGLNSGPGPGITLLIAIVLVLAQTASSAPLYEEDEGQDNNSQSIAESHGCYYNFQHYNEGERILTNEPCLNCTCRNRMLMCYLRVCPFTKEIGQNCTVEKVPGQCCPIITCPEVPVHLLTSTTTEGIKAPGGHYGTKGTEVGHLDTNGCNIDGIFYPNGAQVPGSPEKPCELCYCIRNKTACIMQECALHVDGCRPVYEEGQCFPVRYQCDDSPPEEEPTTTIRPAPTLGLIITTTSAEPLDCTHNGEVFEDGSRIQTEDPCEHCYCLKGKIACAVQECGAPLEKEGQNCTALPPAPGKCCPDSYQCDVTMTSQGLNYNSEGTTEAGIPSIADAGHPTDGYHPEQGIRTTDKPSHPTNLLDHVTETGKPSKGVGEQKPTVTKPQELDKETQNELIESHLQGLLPMKPTLTSDDNQKITEEDTKRPGTPEIGQPETTHIRENESSDHTTDDHSIDMPNVNKQPHLESISHVLGVSTKGPETAKPVVHSEGTVVEHPDSSGFQPTHSHDQTPYESTTYSFSSLKPQTSASDAKDPLLDKLHNIIQDVQAQVSDGKTTEMPEQVHYQTTTQSQTGNFTDKLEIPSHLPQFGSQTTSSGLTEMESAPNKTSPDDSNDIINKLQGIIQGIYSHVTDSATSTRTPESSTVTGETQTSTPVDSSEIIKPEGESNMQSPVPQKENLKPHKESDYPVKPEEVHKPHDIKTAEESGLKDKHTTEKSQPEIYSTVSTIDEAQGTQYPDISGRPQDSKYSTATPYGSHSTKHPENTSVTGSYGDSSSKHTKPVGITPEGLIKFPLRPRPEGSYDEPYGAKYPETTNEAEEEIWSTEHPHVTDRPDLSGTSDYFEKVKPEKGSGTAKRPFDKDNYPGEHKPDEEVPGVTVTPHDQSQYSPGFSSSEKHPEFHPDENRPTVQYPEEFKPSGQYPEEFKPSGQYPEVVDTTQQNLEEIILSGQHPEKFKPGEQYFDGIKPTGYYPEESKPTEQYPEGVKPAGQHSEKVSPTELEGYKPGQQYPDGSRPVGQHPEEVFQSGQYSEKTKPTDQLSNGTRQSSGTKPLESDGIPFEYLEDVTDKSSSDDKYTQTSKYPDKTGQTDTESLSSERPFGVKPTETITISSKPDDVSKYPEKLQPMDEYLVPKKPTGSHSYSTRYPEKSGVTDLTEVHQPGRPEQKPSEKYPEGSNYPEITGITNKLEDKTPESFTSTTHHPEGYKPDEHSDTHSIKDIFDKNKPHDSAESEGTPTENQGETGEHSQPRPGSNLKPSGAQYPGIAVTSESSDSKVTDSLETFSKYPEKTRPEVTEEEEVTGKPGDGSEHSDDVKPTGDYPEDSKFPVTEKPGISKRPYIPGHSEESGVTVKPEKDSKYPEGFKPTDENSPRPKPGSDDESYGLEYQESTDKPQFSYEDSTYKDSNKSSSTQKIGFTNRPDDLKPIHQYPEDSKTSRPQEQSKYPQNLGVENKPYGSESIDRPDEQFTGHPNYHFITKKPEHDDEYPKEVIKKLDGESSYPGQQKIKDELSPGEYQTGITKKPDETYESTEEDATAGRPHTENKYSQKPATEESNVTDQSHAGYKPAISPRPIILGEQPLKKPESENEVYGTKLTESPKVPDVSDSNDKTHGTEYPEEMTDKPVDFGKYPDENKEQGKHPQKPESEHFHEDLPERPDDENPEQSMTSKPEGFAKYPEEIYVTQHPGKIKPPSEDQLLEIHAEPDTLGKYPEKTKPITETTETDKLIDGTKDKAKPDLESDIYDHTEQPGKPIGIYESLGETTKSPPYTAQYSSKPSERPSGSEYPEKTKPIKSPGKPGPENVSYGTEYPESLKPDEAVHAFPTGEIITNRPQDVNKYPEKSKPGFFDKQEGPIKHTTSDFEEKPESTSATDKPEDGQKYPESLQHPVKTKPGMGDLGASGTDRPLNVIVPEEEEVSKPEHPDEEPEKHFPTSTEKLRVTYPLDEKSKYPQMPVDDTFGTEYPSSETGTGKPEDSTKHSDGPKPGQKHPQGTEYPELSAKPEYESKYPEDSTETGQYTQRPYDSQPYPGSEYPDNETTGGPELHTKFPEGNEVEHYPGLTGRPQYSTKYPEGEKLHDSELPHGTESSLETLEYQTKYPEASTKPQKPGKYPESTPPYSEETTDYTMNEYTKHPERVTGLPDDPTKYPERPEPTEFYSGTNENLQGFTKYPEGDHSFHTKYPELGLTETSIHSTKHPANLKPEELHPEQPQVSEENPELSTEYINIEETDRPDLSTNYSEKDKTHVTHQYPTNFGITQEQSPTERIKGSKPTDSFYDTEPTDLSGTSNEYEQKFKPGHGKPLPEGVTEHSMEEKPTGTYSYGSERPEGEKPFENDRTVSTDTVTKSSDNMKPVDSETTIYETEFPEKVTDKPENVKHPNEPGTEYSETNTGKPIKENVYPEEFRPTAEYPHGPIEYSLRPKPQPEHKPYDTEHPETVSTTEDQMEFTRYLYTTKHPQHPGSEETTVLGFPDDLSKYPYGFKPGSENLGVDGRPQGSTDYPQKKPSLENESFSNQYFDKTSQPQSSTTVSYDRKPEGTESFGTAVTDKPEESKYPNDTKYSGITTPNTEHSPRPKPIGSYDSPYGTAYPETTDSESDLEITKTPGYVDQDSSAQYPQRPKPIESGEKIHSAENSDAVTDQPENNSIYPEINKLPTKRPLSTKPGSEGTPYDEKYPQGVGFTKKPDEESKYFNNTGYLTSRPFLGRPKPTGSDQPFVTEYPGVPGQITVSTHPEKPESEDKLQGTEYPEESDKPYLGSRPTGTQYPEVGKPDVYGQQYPSNKYPEVEEQEFTEHLGETEETDITEKSPVIHSQDSKKPQETASPDVSETEDYPSEFKPTVEYPRPSERPHAPSKYPAKPKPGTSNVGSFGEGDSETNENPENEQFSIQHPKVAENTVRPEYEKYPEYTKVTGKPHGIHRYPLRPKPIGFEDDPLGTEYPETTEDLDETSTVEEQDAFSRNPVTEYSEELYVTAKPGKPSKYTDRTKPEDDQFFGTELPEGQKPEGYKPPKHPISSHHPESTSEKSPSTATVQLDNEDKHPEVFKPTERHPDESEISKEPLSSIKHPETHSEDEEKPYSTKYPEGSEPQQPEDQVNTNELFEVTRKPISSSGVPIGEFSAPKPGVAYLPQKGELPSEKVPSSEHLNENSTPVVSEQSSSTEIYSGFTNSAAGSPTEESSLSSLHHFGSHQDKPPSDDLTQEHGSSFSSQDLITKYPEHTTAPSDLHKPIDETRPAEIEINAPISADDYSGRPKPIVPDEGLHRVQEPVESSSLPSKISEVKRPEVLSGSDVAGTKKPNDQISEVEGTQYPSQTTARPGAHEYPDSTNNLTSDSKLPQHISTAKPEDYYTTPGKHKATTSRQPSDGNLESTDHPAYESTHSEEALNPESATEYTTHENYPEGISHSTKDFTKRPVKDSVSLVKSTTDPSLSTQHSGVQKTTTPSDDDLINKLHNIISGIQSQVIDGKTTKQPYGSYESTSPSELSTDIPQDYYSVTNKFGRPVQKPQDFVKFPLGQTSESLSTPSRRPIDGFFSSENEIYDQTTTDVEETKENQTDEPEFGYTSAGGSTDHSVFVTSKGPEGIRPTEMGDGYSTKYPQHETAEGFPVKPQSTEFEKPHDVKHPEQFDPVSKYPTNESVTEEVKPETSFSTELPDRSTKPENKNLEDATVQFFQKPSVSSSASFPQYPEDISTTASPVTEFQESRKPDLTGGNQIMVETPVKNVSTTATYSYTEDWTTQIYQEIKGNQTPIENVDNLIAESNKTAPHQEDLLHEIVSQDVNQKHPTSVSTDKPLHVVYPTYYPDGVVTRIPATKPDGDTNKKVTVTPQNIIHEGTTIKNIESDVTIPSKFEETQTIYEAHTEVSQNFSATSPVVIIQEVHTEVHSERAPIKTTDTDSYAQQTTVRTRDSEPDLNKGQPHDSGPEHGFEEFTKQPELSSQTPQIIFSRPAIIQPTGDQLIPGSQTFQPHAGYLENEKFSTLSTRPEYPTKQQESSIKPEFVTVTPIGFVPVTKGTDNIMHLYSSKNKHPTSTPSNHHPESFTTASPVYPEGVEYTTAKGETADLTEIPTSFVTDQGSGTTNTQEILGTRLPFRKTTQKPTDGVFSFQEGTTITPTQGIGEQFEVPQVLYPGVTKRPSFDISTEGLPTQNKTSEVAGFTTTKEGITQRPQGVSFVPYKYINGNKVYYPENESSERPTSEPSSFDGYDQIPYEIVNGTKFFYPNRVVTSQPTTSPTLMGMYVPYKIVNGSKIYYTQDKTQKPGKFDGLDYVPFDIINGTKIFYPEKVTTTASPSLAMYVPFKIIDGTKVYYTKEAQEEPQNIPDEYDGFDYVPYSIVNGNKIFSPDHKPDHVTTTTDHLQAMYVPYKLINGNRVYYPKDAKTKPEFVPEGYDGFDLVPYEVVNGTKLFNPDSVTTKAPDKDIIKTSAMFVPFKVINGTKVYFPKYAQNKPVHTTEGYDGFDYLPYEDVNGTKVFRPEKVTPKPEFTSTPAFYSSGMFVPYKIINNTKVFFAKDAQHKPRPLKPGYDGVQYLPYNIINGTKVFYPERITTPTPILPSALYVPYKLINGTKVYYADKATENPEKIPEGYEGFDYVSYEIISGNKLPSPNKLKPTTGMYVPYKKVNGSKVYYPKDSSEKHQPIPEGYDGVDYIPYEIINETKVFYPDRITTTQPTPAIYVPYKMINGTKVYYPKDAQEKPHLVPEGYDGFDSLPYETVNGTNVFHPEYVTQRPAAVYSQGMFVPYKMINGTKVYYPQEAHKRPHPLSDEYAGLDYIPYEVVNGTKVFYPERLTPGAAPAIYVPYKLINGTKVFYPKHAQHNPQQILPEYDGFEYVSYEIINGSQVFYPNRVPIYQGMYVPYKIINGEKVFYPKYAQNKTSEIPDGYDGFDYLPYEGVNGTDEMKPTETVTETPFEQAMYVPYKVLNGTKVFYADYAQYKPYLIPSGFDGFDYIPYEIVNGTKVFDPELAVTPSTPYKPAMYVPYKIIDGKKVYYSKHAQNKPHLVPEGYDGFDYIPYEVVNGTKVFDPEQAVVPGPDIKLSLYVPYKIINGIKVYQPKHAQHKPLHLPQGYEGFDYLPYDVVNGNKLFYPEQSIPLKQAMYVPFKYVNGTKVFYPKYAQYVPIQTPEDYNGLEYIPYEIVKGDKVFHPEQAIATETPFRKAVYVPYKVLNGTKIYYPKNSHHNPYLIPQGYDGFDYIPYEIVNGNKVFHPEQAVTPETLPKQAMYVPFRVINGTKVYYPKHAQSKPQLTLEKYDGFDYLPYKVVNGTKVFDPVVSSRPTYLQGMYVPYKSVNNTKVFYPKDAHNKPNYIPDGYDGADYVPYEPLNNTKMFYPELISTAQHGSAGVYVPFKVVNNKKVFYPKEATPFPPTVRYPYDGVAFVPHKKLDETSPSEIIYVDGDETFKPHQPFLQPGEVPGEGSCYINNKTFANFTEIPPVNPCQASCICISSVVRCVRVKCPSPPEYKLDCSPVYREGSCCPTYVCGDSNYEYSTTTGHPETKVPEFAGTGSSGHGVDATTPIVGYGTQKKPSHELEDITGQKPEVQAPSEEYHLHKPPKPKPEHESLEPYDNVEGQLTPDEDYDVEDEEPYGPGTCRYAGKVYVSAQQIPRDDPCDFCFCFRSDIICLQQSCPPPIPGCRDEPIQGFCCPRYECHVKMATVVNVTSTTTTTTTTTLPPHFFPHAFKGSTTKTGCFVQGRAYRVGQAIPSASGPCMDCICGGNGRMKCEPKVCTPEPMIRKMINPSENVTLPSNER